MQEVLWQLESVSLVSRGHTRLRDVSLRIEPGVTAVLGQSGAGKTSLLNVLVGLDEPTSGNVHTKIATDRANGRPALFWVPQDQGLWPHLTAAEHLAMVRSGAASSSQHTTDDQWLALFELSHRRDAKPAQLSLGERARLSVARALATEASVIVMDEPLAHVDAARVPQFWQAMDDAVKEIDASWIFATHEPETVLAHARQVIAMDAGTLLFQGEVDTLYHDPASEQAAKCMGDVNWLTAAETRKWLFDDGEGEASLSCCIRPEQLRIELDLAGTAAVESSVFRGPLSHVRLNHSATGESRDFIVQSPATGLKPGDRVRLIDLRCVATRRIEGVPGD